MAEIIVYGVSDDLIEVEGDLRYEFAYLEPHPNHLVFSDGTVLRVVYGDDGCWEIRVVAQGNGTTVHMQNHDGDLTSYSDRVTLQNPLGDAFQFVAHATDFHRRA